MEQRSLRAVGILGLVAIVGMMSLYFFGLQTVVDPSAGASSGKIYGSLKRSLDADLPAREAVRVTMQRKGKGVEAPRHYTVRLAVSAAVGADVTATGRLLERAAEILAGDLQKVKVEVTMSCVGLRKHGEELRREFRRLRDGAGYHVVPAEPVRPAPAAAAGGDDASK